MEKIVIGISDEASERAVDWVIERTKRNAVDVRLILSFDAMMSDPLEDERKLERAKERIGAASPSSRVTTALVEKSIPESILPSTEDADLLVIGTHHRGFLGSVFAGTPSLGLAARSECATVIVPERWVPTSRGVIIVGLQDDGSSDAAIDFAARETVFERSRLEVVHSWSASLPGLPTAHDILIEERTMRSLHRDDLTAQVARIRATVPESRVTGISEEGPAASVALVERAQRADLLVIGSHRRGAVTGLLIGSTAARMLPTLSTPLCIVPPVRRAGTTTSDLGPESSVRTFASGPVRALPTR